VLKAAIAALERNDPNRLMRDKLTYETSARTTSRTTAPWSAC
jgi:hypothetical protein